MTVRLPAALPSSWPLPVLFGVVNAKVLPMLTKPLMASVALNQRVSFSPLVVLELAHCSPV